MQDPILHFVQVSKEYSGIKRLKNVSFDVYPGEILGLIGPSGAGKTTLLKSLIGYHHVTDGQIVYQGKDIAHNKHLMRSITGFAAQESSLYEELTVQENIMYFGKLHGMKKYDIIKRMTELLALVGLADEQKTIVNKLSGGMRKRIDLVCGLLHGPQILIMDEPTTGLDPLLRKQMWQLVQAINRQGTTILISSHILDDVEHLCHRIAMIHEGGLVFCGAIDMLKSQYTRNYEIIVESFPGKYRNIIQELRQRRLPIAQHYNKEHSLVLYTPQPQIVLHHLMDVIHHHNEKLRDITMNKPSLSEVFEAYNAAR